MTSRDDRCVHREHHRRRRARRERELRAATYAVAEDGTVDVTVTLDVAPEREVTIPIVKTDEGGITQDDVLRGEVTVRAASNTVGVARRMRH